MSFQMSMILRLLRPWLPEELVSDKAHRRIAALAARLPPIWEWGTLECRLVRERPQVDLMICVGSYQRARQVTERVLANAAYRAILAPVKDLLDCWAYGQDALLAKVPVFWLEYDLPLDADNEPPAPLVSLGLDPGLVRPDEPLAPANQHALARRGLGLLHETPPEAAWELLRRCAETLPHHGRILHVDSLSPRGAKRLKIMASMPSSAKLPQWLDRIEWPGDRALLRTLLSLGGKGWHSIAVQLELGEAVSPYLGLELHAAPWDSTGLLEQQLCERLSAHGLCAPEKVRAALAWAGDDTVDDPALPWTLHLQRRMYLKLVAHPEGALEVKTYLGFHPSHVLMRAA